MLEKRSKAGRALVLIALPEEEDILHLGNPSRLQKLLDIWQNLPPGGTVVVDLPKATKATKATTGRKVEKVAL